MAKPKVNPAAAASDGPPAAKKNAGSPDAAAGRARSTRQRAAARVHAEAMRQAECAAMLIAVTRLLLNMGGRDYAAWLRSVADDFEATDLEQEHPDDISDDLIRISERDRQRERTRQDEEPEPAEPVLTAPDSGRPH